MDVRELLAGCGGGALGVTLSYPVDTVKTWRQTGTQFSWKGLYHGYSSPLVGMMIEKSVLFFGYDYFRRVSGFGVVGSGLGAGVLTTAVVTPFERVKIRSQVLGVGALRGLVRTVRSDGLLSLYRGWSATLFREVPGFGIYFSVYETMKPWLTQLSGSPGVVDYRFGHYGASMVSGAMAGMSAWAVIYPSDPVKTMAQNENIGVGTAMRKIWESSGIRGFYRGFTPALIRAGILHSGVFLGYELSKDLLVRD